MRYTLSDIGTFIAEPGKHQDKYTETLLQELVEHVFANDVGDVWSYLTMLPDHANSIRVKLACVHLSVNPETGEGSTDNLVKNIDLASQDYRDLLMAYYT